MPEEKRDPADYPLVLFDAKERKQYHLEGGKRVDHGIPEGFRFNAEGVLEPLPAKEK